MSTSSPLILAVDDETDDIFFLRRTLNKTGVPHRFQPYSNAEAAIAALSAIAAGDPKSEPPIICFLDIKMVGMSGLELLRWIRNQRALDTLPVIMFSTSYPRDMHYENDIMKLLYKIGAKDYIRKPENFNLLKEVIHGILVKIAEELSAKSER